MKIKAIEIIYENMDYQDILDALKIDLIILKGQAYGIKYAEFQKSISEGHGCSLEIIKKK